MGEDPGIAVLGTGRREHPDEPRLLVLFLVPEDFRGGEGKIPLAKVAVVGAVQGGDFGRVFRWFFRGGCREKAEEKPGLERQPKTLFFPS